MLKNQKCKKFSWFLIKLRNLYTCGLRAVISHKPKSGPLGSSRQTWRGVTEADICSEILLFNRLLVGLLQEKHIPINSQNIGSSYCPFHGSLMKYAFLRLTGSSSTPHLQLHYHLDKIVRR